MKVVVECWIDRHILFPLKIFKRRHPRLPKNIAVGAAVGAVCYFLMKKCL